MIIPLVFLCCFAIGCQQGEEVSSGAIGDVEKDIQAIKDMVSLTALDYYQIQQLVAKYARAIDTCSNNGYDYADLFTPNGFFAPSMNGKVGLKWQGRERLAEASGGGVHGCKNVPWIEEGVHHIYVNHIITPTAQGATGTVDMLMIGLGGDPNKIEYDGYYKDVYAKTSQGWRFKSRIHHALLDQGKPAVAAPATAR